MCIPFFRYPTLAAQLPQAAANFISLGVARNLFNNKGEALHDNRKTMMSYSSILEFTVPSETAGITDGQLIRLAQKAHQEMMTAYGARFGPGKERNAPAAMIAFAPGGSRDIFLGSSIKNAGKKGVLAFYTQDLLVQFLKTFVHTKSGKCGEFNVLEAFFDLVGNTCQVPAGSRMVAWLKDAVVPPCSVEGKSGCAEFVASVGNIRAIEGGQAAELPSTWRITSYNYRNLAGNAAK